MSGCVIPRVQSRSLCHSVDLDIRNEKRDTEEVSDDRSVQWRDTFNGNTTTYSMTSSSQFHRSFSSPFLWYPMANTHNTIQESRCLTTKRNHGNKDNGWRTPSLLKDRQRMRFQDEWGPNYKIIGQRALSSCECSFWFDNKFEDQETFVHNDHLCSHT
jgi:hypothetical protein